MMDFVLPCLIAPTKHLKNVIFPSCFNIFQHFPMIFPSFSFAKGSPPTSSAGHMLRGINPQLVSDAHDGLSWCFE
jgi:hypothetical protein